MTLRLAAGRAALEVDPDDGGRWTALRVADLELLGAASIPGGYPPMLSGCFVMAPYAGRVRDALLSWRGRDHRLPATAPPHAIHGTVLDVPWQVRAAGTTAATLQVELDERWPWRGRVVQQLRLAPDRLQARVVLRAGQDMPATLGLHPWFRRRLDRGGPAQLDVQGGRQWQRAPDGLPTGALVPPGPGPWDDCFTGLQAPPVLRWPGALRLTLSSSSSTWVLFDERPEVLCVEPQTGPPDAVRLGRSDVVPAGRELALSVELRWQLAPLQHDRS